MSRPKGDGAIKFIEATKQDDVAMRRMLRRDFAWQEQATAYVFQAYLLGDTPKTLTEHEREAALATALANSKRDLELVEQRKREQAAMTRAEFDERMRKHGVAEYKQWRRRRGAAGFVLAHTAQSDKVLALAGRDSEGRVIKGKVNITLRELRDHLRVQDHTPPIDSVRRFLRTTLHVTLRSEQGKRSDLEKGKR
jgi:hypothetical protein